MYAVVDIYFLQDGEVEGVDSDGSERSTVCDDSDDEVIVFFFFCCRIVAPASYFSFV